MSETKASTSIRTAILHPGRSRAYIKREFGKKAFEMGGSGKVKPEYWNKAIKKAEGNTSLKRALVDGKNLSKVAAEKMRG